MIITMAVHRISATEASRSFSELLSRVKYAGEEFLVERGGVPFCRIVAVDRKPCLTIGELARVVAARGIDPGFGDDVEEAIRLGNTPSVPQDPWKR